MTPPTRAGSRPTARQSPWSQFTSLQIGQASALAIGAAAVIVVSRALGPDVYGGYALFVAVAQYAVILTVSWTTASMVRFGADERAASGRLTSAFWARLAAMGPSIALVVVALALGRRQVASMMAADVSLALLLAMIVALALADHADAVLQAAGLWTTFAWLGAIEKAAFLGGIALAGYAAGARSLRAAIIVALAAQVLRIAVAAVAIARAGVVAAPALDRAMLRRIVAYSWPHLFTFTVGYFSAFAEPFIIKSYLAVREVGIYQVAFQISLFGGALLSPLSSMIFPAVTQLRMQQRREVVVTLLARLVPQFVFVVTIALILAMGLARAVFVPVFGPAFASALRPLLILMGALSFQAVVAMYSPILAAYDLTKHSAALNTVGGILVHLLPTIVLVYVWGISGAAASWLIWYAFSAAFCLWVVNRHLPVQTYSTLVYPMASLAALAIALVATRAVVEWAGLAAVIAATAMWGRHQRLFQTADVSLLETLGMPAPLRRFAARTYPLLESDWFVA